MNIWFIFRSSWKEFPTIFDTDMEFIWNCTSIKLWACEWHFSNNHIIITNPRRNYIFARNDLSISSTDDRALRFLDTCPNFSRVLYLVSYPRASIVLLAPFHASFPADKSSVSIRLTLKGRYRSRLFSIESFERKREERARNARMMDEISRLFLPLFVLRWIIIPPPFRRSLISVDNKNSLLARFHSTRCNYSKERERKRNTSMMILKGCWRFAKLIRYILPSGFFAFILTKKIWR